MLNQIKNLSIVILVLAYGFGAYYLGRYSVRSPGPPAEDNTIYQVAPGDSPAQGPLSAPVVIVEFSDFQCPFCAKAQDTVKDVLRKYPQKVRLVYKHYPLGFHAQAPAAAAAAIAAGEQGKFWEMHDLLFANTDKLDEANLRKYARQLGLNVSLFDSRVKTPEVKAIIDRDIAQAGRLNVTGTPTFFINGQKLVGARPLSEFQKRIDLALSGKVPGEAKPGLWGRLFSLVQSADRTQRLAAQP